MIVRAHLDGRDFFLDGTTAGATAENLGDRTSFRWGLPVTPAGEALVALPAGAPSTPSSLVTNAIDLRAGPDFDGVVDSKVQLFGPVVRKVQSFEQVPAGRQRDDLLDKVFAKLYGNVTVIDRTLTIAAGGTSATLTARFVEDARWKRNGKRWSYAPIIPGQPDSFKPDRARRDWAAIPVDLGAGARARTTLIIQVPRGGNGVSLDGGTLHFASRIATIDRTTNIAAGTITIAEDIAGDGGELTPAEIAAQRAKSVELDAATINLRLPPDTTRSWQMIDAASRAAVAPLLAAYTKLIADRPDEVNGLMQRGYIYQQIGRYDLARADFDKAVALDGSAESYGYRGSLREVVSDLPGAVADETKADELDPTADRLNTLAYSLESSGRAKDALALIDPALDSAGDNRPYLLRSKALALGWLGRQREGLDLLTDLLADRPGDADTLDFACWYRGLWNIGLDAVLGDCDKAVTQANYSASALQSRAVAKLRLGKFAEAKVDIDAALDLDPGNETYLLTRGMVRQVSGDPSGGKADIAEAERRNRSVGKIYRAAGLLR